MNFLTRYSQCYLCNYAVGDIVCQQCLDYFIINKLCCIRCAHPLPAKGMHVCGECLKQPPYFDRTIAAYLYQEPIKTLLLHLKFKQQLFISDFLAQIISKNVSQCTTKLPQCIIPVPLHPIRIKHRGFNQAVEIAKRVSRQLTIPIDSHCCIRQRHTLPQLELKAKLRKKNLSGAFYCKPINYQHVAIIDDVMTTGNTVNELAKALKKQGVTIVEVWCPARTNSQSF